MAAAARKCGHIALACPGVAWYVESTDVATSYAPNTARVLAMKSVAPIFRPNFTLLSCALVAATFVGCESKRTSAPAKPAVDSSPQAKYERVIQALREGLRSSDDSNSIRHTIRDAAGSGTAVVSYEIDAPSEITKPQGVDEAPRATVAIITIASYSSLPAAGKGDSEEQDRDKPRSASGDSAESQLSDMGIEVMDAEQMTEDFATANAPRLKPPGISTRTSKTETKVVYELMYEKDRWRLAAPPKADALESTNMAMQMALKRQM